MRYISLLGRIFYSLIFLLTIASHFKKETIAHAANQGVPFADFLVPASAVIAFMGGYSIVVGYYARYGAWLIVIFLIPVTFYMHAFWNETDPAHKMMQMAQFMKNTSLLGAALMITYLGVGPLSWDERMESKKSKTN
ncbi:MAG: DoxX family protein [Bacteroidia bacterium]